MGKVLFAGVSGVFAVTLAISFAVTPKDVRPLGDDTINFVNNVKLSLNTTEKKVEEPAAKEWTSTLSSGNRDIIVTKGGTGKHGNSERLTIIGSGNYVVNWNVHDGVTLGGSATLTIHGNVDGGVLASGSGNLAIDGNVWGGITKTESRSIYVGGDVYGNINAGGSGFITVRGRHLGGTLTISGSAQVHILDPTVPK